MTFKNICSDRDWSPILLCLYVLTLYKEMYIVIYTLFPIFQGIAGKTGEFIQMLTRKHQENGPRRTAGCHNEIRCELANCSYQNQKAYKYLDTVRLATGLLIDHVNNFQLLKDDDVTWNHYISRNLNNVTYNVHPFVFEGLTRLTLADTSAHHCNTRVLFLPTSLSLTPFTFCSHL